MLPGLDRICRSKPGKDAKADKGQHLQGDNDDLLGRPAQAMSDTLEADEAHPFIGGCSAEKGDGHQQMAADLLRPAQRSADIAEDHLRKENQADAPRRSPEGVSQPWH